MYKIENKILHSCEILPKVSIGKICKPLNALWAMVSMRKA
jgi:hypothetical protein